MPVSFTKPETNPATQDRLAEVMQIFQRMADGFHAAPPAFGQRLTEISTGFRSVGKHADR